MSGSFRNETQDGERKGAVLLELFGQLDHALVADVVVPVDRHLAAILERGLEQVEDVHHRLDAAGIEVQQAQFEAERVAGLAQEAFDPLVDLMEQFVGIFRIGIALHRDDAFFPVGLDSGSGLAAGDGKVVHGDALEFQITARLGKFVSRMF